MLEYELMYFFIGAPIWNLPVIIASCVGFSRARKGKSPVGAFLIGIIVFAIPVWGEYLGNKRRNTGYLLSEEVIIALVFCAIYLCITLPLAIKKYNRYNNEMVYYCVSCGNDFNADARDETQAKFKCPKCGAPLVNTSILSAEWELLTPEGKKEALQQFITSKYSEPVDTEPAETEPVDTEPAETEPVDTEPENTEPEDTEPEDTEPEDTEPVDTKSDSFTSRPDSFSGADEIRKYKALMDEGIITQEEFEVKKKQLLGL